MRNEKTNNAVYEKIFNTLKKFRGLMKKSKLQEKLIKVFVNNCRKMRSIKSMFLVRKKLKRKNK